MQKKVTELSSFKKFEAHKLTPQKQSTIEGGFFQFYLAQPENSNTTTRVELNEYGQLMICIPISDPSTF